MKLPQPFHLLPRACASTLLGLAAVAWQTGFADDTKPASEPPPVAAPEAPAAPGGTPASAPKARPRTGQGAPQQYRMDPTLARRYGLNVPPPEPAGEPAPDEPRFDLDFGGGPPRLLVDAVSKASGRALNVIIPEMHDDIRIPEMHMKRVTVSSLFDAVSEASKRNVYQTQGRPYGMQFGGAQTVSVESYGFRRSGNDEESPVWVFYYEKPPSDTVETPRSVRFFQLAPYLDGPNGLKVEDITTAIQTGYNLLGERSAPELKFHKETRLLIAVGDPHRLALIDEVLSSLPNTVTIDPTTGLPVGTTIPASRPPPPGSGLPGQAVPPKRF